MLNNWVNTYYTNYEMGKYYSKKQVGEKYIKITIINALRTKY
jgi:hypothetical protein